MAIDYGNYVQLQGAGVDTSPLQQGVAKFLEKNKEMNQLAAQNFADTSWQNMMNPYQSALITDVNSWNATNFVGLSPGEALAAYKKNAMKNPKVYNILAQNGEFSPVTFKQKYDQLKASYMPSIEQKLASFKQLNNFDDIDMKDYVKGQPDLQRFLLDNADPAGVARNWAMPHTPQGFIGGAIGEVAGDPLRYGVALGGGSAAFGAISGGVKGGLAGVIPGAKAGLKSQYAMPFKAGQIGKGGVVTAEEIAKQFENQKKGKAFGKGFDKKTKTGRSLWNRRTGSARRSRNTAFEKATGKKWDPNAKGAQKSLQTRWSTATNWKNKTGKTAKAKRGLGKGGAAITNKLDTAKGFASQADKQMGKGALNKINTLLKTKGRGAVIKALAKNVGFKKAAALVGRLAAGTALTGSGFGTVAGIAMNAYTLYEVANILEKAFKETGGIRRPDQMLFGGGSKGDYINQYKLKNSK